jgi:ferric-dicitrate binding protein FerR (iron transport regulator)
MAVTEFDRETIERYFRGEYTEKDAAYIEKIFIEAGYEKELKHLLSRQYYDILSDDDKERRDLDNILYRINYDISTKQAEKKAGAFAKFRAWSLRIAAMLILPLSVFWGIKGYINYSTAKETWVEIKAPAWTRVQFSLPDGTTGWLNSNSSVRYNGTFNSDRQVTLTGEAFFDVFKDEKRPFRVSTDEIMVKALGTRFNVASYENEKNVEVVLEEGKIELSGKEIHRSHLMDPNELIVFDRVSKSLSSETVQPQKYISWTEGKLVFRNDPVDIIARRLERWYNVDVEVMEGFTGDLRLRATFTDENLEEVLYFLKRSLPISYTIENGDLQPDDSVARKKVILTYKTKKYLKTQI